MNITKKILILLIALVCITSTAYGLFLNQSPEIDNNKNNNDVNFMENIKNFTQPYTVNTLDKLINENMGENDGLIKIVNHEIRHYITNNSFYIEGYDGIEYQYSFGYIKEVNGELRHYINNKGAYYLESESLTDRYIQCVECGGYIPVGNITEAIPAMLICHNSNLADKISLENINETLSYDEIFLGYWNLLDISKDKIHEIYDNAYFEAISEDDLITCVYCKDCDGDVLSNSTIEELVNSSFSNDNGIILNLHTFYGTYKKCSHYEGTLDILNTPVEIFPPGWFRSVDDYNNWQEKTFIDNSTDVNEDIAETTVSVNVENNYNDNSSTNSITII